MFGSDKSRPSSPKAIVALCILLGATACVPAGTVTASRRSHQVEIPLFANQLPAALVHQAVNRLEPFAQHADGTVASTPASFQLPAPLSRSQERTSPHAAFRHSAARGIESGRSPPAIS